MKLVNRNFLGVVCIALIILASFFFASFEYSFAQTTSTSTETGPGTATTTENTVTNTTSDIQAIFNGISGTSIPIVGLSIKLVLYIVLMFVTTLIYLMGYLISAALEFNISLLDFNPPFIISGWQIFRDIANLGFVLGIILIGVATILRIKSYQAQSILWKLIVAALLVNFSLVIAGAFIEVSHSISNYILSYIGAGGSNEIGTGVTRIGDSFRFFEVANNVSGWGGGFWSDAYQTGKDLAGGQGASLGVIASLAVLILFASIVFVTLLAFFVLMFLRYFYLAFLLIISPIVWLLWVFPNTQDHWRKWWKTFINWVLYAPLVLFFVYLSLSVIDKYAQYSSQVQSDLAAIFSLEDGSINFGLIMSTLVAVALLIGGMKIARGMGEGGANLAFSLGDKVSGWAKNKAKNAARRGTARVGRKILKTKPLQSTQQKFASWAKFKTVGDLKKERDEAKEKGGLTGAMASTVYGAKMTGKVLSKVTGAGLVKRAAMKQAGLGLKSLEKQSEKTSQESSDDFEKKIKDYSHDDIKNILPALNKEEALIAMKKLADMDKLEKAGSISTLDPKKLYEILQHAKSLGRGKDASAIEKKIMINTDMLKALSDIKALKDIDPEDEKKEAKKKEAEKRFKEAKNKFYNGFSQDDWKGVDKELVKKLYTDSLEGIPGGEYMGKAIKDSIEDLSGEIMKGTLHGISSRLEDSKDLMRYYKNVIYSVVDKNDPKIKDSVKEFLDVEEDISATNFDALMDILKSSNVTKVSNFAKKFKKVIGTRIGLVDDGDKKDKGKKEETFKMPPGFRP